MPMTSRSSQLPNSSGCGTPEPAIAPSTRASRSIVSLLFLRRCCGGRRSTICASPRCSRKMLFWDPPCRRNAPVTGPSPGRSCPAIHSFETIEIDEPFERGVVDGRRRGPRDLLRS